MTTLLARIRIKPGCEARWEAIVQSMVRQTLANEAGVLRYEYWKGQEPNLWYSLFKNPIDLPLRADPARRRAVDHLRALAHAGSAAAAGRLRGDLVPAAEL